MVKMEIMQRTEVPRTDQLQGIDADEPDCARRQGLAGLSKSRALFSFQRSETHKTPRGAPIRRMGPEGGRGT